MDVFLFIGIISILIFVIILILLKSIIIVITILILLIIVIEILRYILLPSRNGAAAFILAISIQPVGHSALSLQAALLQAGVLWVDVRGFYSA